LGHSALKKPEYLEIGRHLAAILLSQRYLKLTFSALLNSSHDSFLTPCILVDAAAYFPRRHFAADADYQSAAFEKVLPKKRLPKGRFFSAFSRP